MSCCASNAGMEMCTPLINGTVNNALIHCSPHTDQTLPQIIHLLYCHLVDSLLNHGSDFVVTGNEVMAVW